MQQKPPSNSCASQRVNVLNSCGPVCFVLLWSIPYTHIWYAFVFFCCDYIISSLGIYVSYSRILVRVASLSLGQSYGFLSDNEVTLNHMDDIHHHQTRTKHNKARGMSIFLGNYCTAQCTPQDVDYWLWPRKYIRQFVSIWSSPCVAVQH